MIRKVFYLIVLFGINSFCSAQQNAPNDCINAIEVCGSGILSSNANGTGAIQEISSFNSCGGSENNSLWLRIEIQKGGSLGFDLKPTSTNIQVDYDFFVFGPNSDCNDLKNAIRCSTSNPLQAGLSNNFTGMNDEETDNSEGPGSDGNSYVKSLDVEAGEIYYIVIDRPIGSSPFELEWTGTATENGNPFAEGPVVTPPDDLFSCNFNGIAEFDLAVNDKVNTQSGTKITYHESLANAVDNENALPKKYTSYQTTKPIFIRVENELTGCAVFEEFNLFIENGPEINPSATIEVCDLEFNNYVEFNLEIARQDILIDSEENFNISYHLTENEAKQSQNPVDEIYESNGEPVFMRVEDIYDEDCFNIAEVNLIMNSPPEVNQVEIDQSLINANNNTLTINLGEDQGYAFSLNSPTGPFQENRTFSNVKAGVTTLYIQDANACQIISTEILVIGYDNFFTPNNDGYNDYWNIKGITSSGITVNIYDRFGKLIIQLDALESGWDGRFNDREMPSDDYWFKTYLDNGTEFSGHFTLKR